MTLLGVQPKTEFPPPLALIPRGSEQITIADSAINLVGLSGIHPTRALIQVNGAPIRWLTGGVTPTSTLGFRVDAGGIIEWVDADTDYSQLITTAKFIRESGVSATLEVLYFD